jgi:hypothetical protein
MKRISTSTKIKIIVTAILYAIYGGFLKYVNPILNNQIAVGQMKDLNDSYGYRTYQMYRDIVDIIPIFIFVIVVLMFIPNIKRLINRGNENE